jgi:hypothetical protein
MALLIEQRLPAARLRGLQAHIDSCTECREIVAELGRSSTRLMKR